MEFVFSFNTDDDITIRQTLIDLITSDVNFTNISRAAFATIFLRQKSTNLKCEYKKAASKTFIQTSCAQIVGEIDTLRTNFLAQSWCVFDLLLLYLIKPFPLLLLLLLLLLLSFSISNISPDILFLLPPHLWFCLCQRFTTTGTRSCTGNF
jgi:hypothetical protein